MTESGGKNDAFHDSHYDNVIKPADQSAFSFKILAIPQNHLQNKGCASPKLHLLMATLRTENDGRPHG